MAALKEAWLRGGEKCRPPFGAEHSSKVKLDQHRDTLRLHDGHDRLMVYSWQRRKPGKCRILKKKAGEDDEETKMQILPQESWNNSGEEEGESLDASEEERENLGVSEEERFLSSDEVADNEHIMGGSQMKGKHSHHAPSRLVGNSCPEFTGTARDVSWVS